MIEYATLKILWWFFIGLLLAGFAVMDGQDMGVGTLLPFLGKNDTERRIMINCVAPHWDGNQVWLLTGAGAIFAAWPLVYAVAFSGLYAALLIVLFALILRPVAFEYRSKVPVKNWRQSWDWLLFAGSCVPPVIFGVAFGNMLLGVPFTFDETMRPIYEGTFFALLNPFALLCGVISLCMMVFHGSGYLMLKTSGELQARSRQIGLLACAVTILLFAVLGLYCAFGMDGFVAQGAAPDGPAVPLAKTVTVQAGAWMNIFYAQPWLFLIPAGALCAGFLGGLCQYVWRPRPAIVCSALMILCIVFTPLVSMFPFVLPSTFNPAASLTIWDCTSSRLTLQVMLFVALALLPVALCYTVWAYHVMAGKVNVQYIRANDRSLY